MVDEVIQMDGKNNRQSKWASLLKKRWFFPAVYLAIAVVLIAVVVSYQQFERNMASNLEQIKDLEDLKDFTKQPPFEKEDEADKDAEAVSKEVETILMPTNNEADVSIVTKYFDSNVAATDQEEALKLYNNKYYQNKGVDLAQENGDSFDVLASLSGKALEVKEDPLHGYVITIEHDEDISTYYASLDDIQVDVGDEVTQGDVIAKAGSSLFGEQLDNHLHFELHQGEEILNPEKFFNVSISNLRDESQEQEDESNQDEDISDESN